LLVFIRPRSLTDKHQFGIRIPHAKHDLLAPLLVQLAARTVTNIFANILQRRRTILQHVQFFWHGGFWFSRLKTLASFNSPEGRLVQGPSIEIINPHLAIEAQTFSKSLPVVGVHEEILQEEEIILLSNNAKKRCHAERRLRRPQTEPKHPFFFPICARTCVDRSPLMVNRSWLLLTQLHRHIPHFPRDFEL